MLIQCLKVPNYSIWENNLKDFEFLFSELESPYLNLCLDIGHANTSEGPLAYIQKFGKKIISIHFHDNNGKNDDHLDVGEGTVPWKKVAEASKGLNSLVPSFLSVSNQNHMKRKMLSQNILKIVARARA